MKKIAVGILAHVDAGKTTLSEGLLYSAGKIRTLGRVDSRNTFLDTNEIERKRGITVFSKQAVFDVDGTSITLLDTPGHTDFAAEAERTLQILDYAVLVTSATDGVQGHTKTLWEMLENHNIPTFIFINKLDLDGADSEKVIDELKTDLGGNFVNFSDTNRDSVCENIAMCDEKLLKTYLECGKIDDLLLKKAIRLRNIFPVFCGSALKMDGVEQFLKGISYLTEQKNVFPVFGAKVFKIAQDDRGQRLTFLKVSGGNLRVKGVLKTSEGDEKINEIRIYSGEKYQSCEVADAGTVCAVTGLTKTFAGQGLGFEENSDKLTAEPIFTYRVILPEGVDTASGLSMLKTLEEEETQLSVVWNEQLKEIQLRLMGEIQLEVLKQVILSRFDMTVEFEEGRIVYKETIENIVEGVGHYEPLRHYAEVHLLLEPLPRGTGVHFATDCPEDELDKNWQRLIMTHLLEKTHIGVLTGSPITDIKITLKSGKAHLKHTDGGDFRQATYRAVRQGLRSAKSVLLEPYYEFVLDVPNENVGKAMTDLDFLGAEFTVPQSRGEMSKISGKVPAEAIRNYHRDLIGYTHGKGKLSCKFCGYGACRNADEVVEKIGYNCDADIENTADSVFCDHGAGFNVKWNEVPQYMHLDSILKTKKAKESEQTVNKNRTGNISASDDELIKIFERTYGKIERKNPNYTLKTQKTVQPVYKAKKADKKYDKEYLLIDGYNIIFAWDELCELAKDSLEGARSALIEKMSAYRIFCDTEVIVVFDAYRVKGNIGEVERVNGITVVYTKEAQTADAYIEKTAKELSKKYKVTVATSDGLEQLIIFGSGAFRLSARALKESVQAVEKNVSDIVSEYNIQAENSDFLRIIREKLEKIEQDK